MSLLSATAALPMYNMATPPVGRKAYDLPNPLASSAGGASYGTPGSAFLMGRSGHKRNASELFVRDSTFLHGVEEKLVVALVGMPARGKSSISAKLRRFLTWSGYRANVFNVGDRRREVARVYNLSQTSEFFSDVDPNNSRLRDKIAMEVLNDSIRWLKEGGHVAIHDATNSTKARRKMIIDRIAAEPGVGVLFIESICTDADLIQFNISLKANSPDYQGLDKEEAIKDFMERLRFYEERYQTLDEKDESHCSYLKLINVGSKVLINEIHGHLQSQIVMYLLNYHVTPRSIWVTRHGESIANTMEILGGDSSLSSSGSLYSKALAKFVEKKKAMRNVPIWTSNLVRTHETVAGLPEDEHARRAISALNEIYAGSCEGMTYEQIAELMPEEFEARQRDKLRYRYPGGGESYMDVIARLKPLIIELERKKESILIVAHQAILRALMGYFLGTRIADLPHVPVPLNTIFKLTPTPFGCEQTTYSIDLAKYINGEEKFWTKEKKVFSLFGNRETRWLMALRP